METVSAEVKVSKKELLKLKNEQLAKLEKELADSKRYQEMYSRLNTEKETEINDAHDFIDGLDGVLAKEKDSYRSNKLISRLASMILVLSKNK